ncbi:sigma-54 interaction domain-containing protein [Lysobacter sp. A421]
MAAIPHLSRQCVIWFGRPLQRERDALAAAGWQVRIANLADGGGVGMRGGDTVVGLVDFRSAGNDGLAQIEPLTSDYTYLLLMAIRPARATTADPATQRLLDHCVKVFTTPVDLTSLIHALDIAIGSQHGGDARGIDALIGKSPVMQDAHLSIRKYAQVDLSVLITGATGTGKEVAARAMHDLSSRRTQPFAAINCGALPANLVQSELFGHERGAFTGATTRRAGLFEFAEGGTVFLDEIGDLPLEAQTNLLRVLQEGHLERVGSHQSIEIDVRVLAATNIDLDMAVSQGRFRSDLFYRLNVLRLHMPDLTDRAGDIELLAQHFLDDFQRKYPGRARSFTPQARQAMRSFGWPGHVRELLNRVQRAAVTADTELITAQDMGLADAGVADVDGALPAGHGKCASAAGNNLLDRAREGAERDAILACLRDSGYNVSEAARRLKVSRVTVYRLCKKHGLVLSDLR